MPIPSQPVLLWYEIVSSNPSLSLSQPFTWNSIYHPGLALNSLLCADVPLRNCSPYHPGCSGQNPKSHKTCVCVRTHLHAARTLCEQRDVHLSWWSFASIGGWRMGLYARGSLLFCHIVQNMRSVTEGKCADPKIKSFDTVKQCIADPL